MVKFIYGIILLLSFWSTGTANHIRRRRSEGHDELSLEGFFGNGSRSLRREEFRSPLCGCDECTEEVWNSVTDGFTCGERIQHIERQRGRTYEDACSFVAGSEYPAVCGACNPATCGKIKSQTDSIHCGCKACTENNWNADAAGLTCGARITWLMQNIPGYSEEKEACRRVAGLEHIAECGPYCDPDQCQQVPESQEASHCGCSQCDEEAWNTDAGGYSCGSRIQWLISEKSMSESEACEIVAEEFPTICGQKCSPILCNKYVPYRSSNSLLGRNVITFEPAMSTSHIQSTIDKIFYQQANNEMGTQRYAMYFKPGVYGNQAQPLMLQIGYYTEVAGLGEEPGSVKIYGKIEVHNRCFAAEPYKEGKFIPFSSGAESVCFALNTFWRSISNLSINIVSHNQDDCRKTAMFWAISQASSMRRVDIRGGDVSLMDYCTDPAYASGGYIADSRLSGGKIISGSQQQFFSRNMEIENWDGAVWNQMFMGVVGAPDDSSYPDPPFTTFSETPLSQEKPFLFIGHDNDYFVQVPSLNKNSRGVSWASGQLTPGTTLPISSFFIVSPEHSVSAINQALRSGKHLMFTPGVYSIDSSILIENSGTIVLGLGHATLTAVNGTTPLKLADRPGIIIAGITIDAGEIESPTLLQVGPPGSSDGSNALADNPTLLSDVYFRVGGPHVGKANVSLEINSNHVLIDHTWIWRADHGVEGFDVKNGFEGDNERWEAVVGRNGVVVNGNDVTATGLFVEHFQEYNLVWTGERGRVFFFQNELPYDPPAQEEWMASDGTKGWAAYKVDDSVKAHELWAGGAYSYNRNYPGMITENGFEVPTTTGVNVSRVYTRNLSGPGIILNVLNGEGRKVDSEDRGPYYILSYP